MNGTYLHKIFSAKSHDNRATMLIGKVAEITGASCKAIRHYEALGIIPTPKRKGIYRVYSDLDIFLVHLIKTAQSLGFSLQEIKELTAAKARQNQFPLPLACLLLDEKRKAIREQIAHLEELEARIETYRNKMVQVFS